MKNLYLIQSLPLLCFFVLININLSKGQSLSDEYQFNTYDRDSLVILDSLCDIYPFIHKDSALHYCHRLSMYSKHFKDSILLGIALINLGNTYREQGKNDVGEYYYQQAKKLFKIGNRQKALGLAYLLLGNSKVKTGSAYVALEFYDSAYDAISQAAQNKDDSIELFDICQGRSFAYRILGVEDKEFDELINAHEIALKIGDNALMVMDIMNMANYASDKGNYRESIVDNKKALELVNQPQIAEELGNPYSANIHIYGSLSRSYKYLGMEDSALHYIKKAENLSGILDSAYNLGVVLTLKAETYDYFNEKQLAFEIFKDAFEVCYKNENYNLAVSNGLATANHLIEINQTEEAKKLGLKCLEISQQMGSLDFLKNCYETLNNLYKTMNMTDSAYYYQGMLLTTKDSVNTLASQKNLADMEAKYKMEQKENKIEGLERQQEIKELKLSQQRQLWLFSVLGLLSLSGIGFLLYYRYQHKRKAELERKSTEFELKALLSQMNPHFIFNSLSSIQSMIVKQKTDQAEWYLIEFAKLIRLILEYSRAQYIPIEEEVKLLQSYLTLEQLRFDHKFKFEIVVDEEIDDEASIPSMMLQPMVENAVIHGVSKLETKTGLITIKFIAKGEDNIQIIVEDNGVGINNSILVKKESPKNIKKTSLAKKITEERVDLFNKRNKGHLSYQILDKTSESVSETGTKVVFEMPLIEN